MERSLVIKDNRMSSVDLGEGSRSKSQLTNAEHHAMVKDHRLLASKISELPHHYFKVEHSVPGPKPPTVVPSELPDRQLRKHYSSTNPVRKSFQSEA